MGTGGCGSGFIWHMLRKCGLETTEHREWIRYSRITRSKDPVNFPAPKVIKHLGGFLKDLNFHLDTFKWEVEHIFFAVATFDLALEIIRERCRGPFNYDEQVKEYYLKLGQGIIQLAERDYPFTIVRCPTSILDSRYCYDKLKVVLPNTTYEEFAKEHAAHVRPNDRERLATYA